MRVQWLNFCFLSFYLSGKAQLSFVIDLKPLIMINKNCLAKALNEMMSQKAFQNYKNHALFHLGNGISKLLKKITRSGKLCYNILQYILKCIVLLCWYSMAVWVSIRCLMTRSWYWSRELLPRLVLVLRPGYQGIALGLKTWWSRSWSTVSITNLKTCRFQCHLTTSFLSWSFSEIPSMCHSILISILSRNQSFLLVMSWLCSIYHHRL